MNQTAKRADTGKRAKSVLPDVLTLFRLAITVILLILAYSIHTTRLISVLILVTAFILVGFNVFASAVNAALKKDYFNNACLITVAAVAAFAAGCYVEASVFLVVFELGGIMIAIAVNKTKSAAASYIPKDDENKYAQLKSLLNRPEAFENSYKRDFEPAAYLISVICVVIAVLLAVILPLISNMTYIMSIRRGAMLIAAAVPLSMFASLPLCSAYGLCYSAKYGVFVKDAQMLENAAEVKAVVFDKSDVITDGVPKISAIISPVLDKQGFLKSAAYTAYKSEQRIAAPIVSAYNGDIVPEYISSFNDIPGCGMEIKIGGQSMLLGTQELLESRGIVLDEKDVRSGYVLYLIISGKYAGCIIFKENLNPYAAKTVSDLNEMGVASYLVAEDGREVSEKTANAIKVSKYYSSCDTAMKLSAVSEVKADLAENEKLMYVSAECIDYHSEADIDARVGYTSDAEDMQMSNIGIFGLPVTLSTAKKIRRISVENLLLAALVKLVLIILAVTGNATLWFIALLDFAAGSFGVLNISKIAKEEVLELDK